MCPVQLPTPSLTSARKTPRTHQTRARSRPWKPGARPRHQMSFWMRPAAASRTSTASAALVDKPWRSATILASSRCTSLAMCLASPQTYRCPAPSSWTTQDAQPRLSASQRTFGAHRGASVQGATGMNFSSFTTKRPRGRRAAALQTHWQPSPGTQPQSVGVCLSRYL